MDGRARTGDSVMLIHTNFHWPEREVNYCRKYLCRSQNLFRVNHQYRLIFMINQALGQAMCKHKLANF